MKEGPSRRLEKGREAYAGGERIKCVAPNAAATPRSTGRVKSHDFFVVRTRECLRCAHRTKTVEMYSFMPMAQAVTQVQKIAKCQKALDGLNKAWASAMSHASRYNLLRR